MGAECESPTGILPASYKQPSLHKAYRMSVVRGPSAGTDRLIDVREFRIGKASANHLALSDPTVSRFHCVVEYTPRGLLLRDLGSKNGTRVDGVSTLSVHLHAGARIVLGRTQLIFEPRTDRSRLR